MTPALSGAITDQPKGELAPAAALGAPAVLVGPDAAHSLVAGSAIVPKVGTILAAVGYALYPLFTAHCAISELVRPDDSFSLE